MSQMLNKSYSLAALLVHSAKQDVTADRIKAVFEALNLEFSNKVASMFELSSDRYNAMLTSVGSSAPAVPTGASASAAVAEEAPGSDSEESSDNVLDF